MDSIQNTTLFDEVTVTGGSLRRNEESIAMKTHHEDSLYNNNQNSVQFNLVSPRLSQDQAASLKDPPP